jgi:hypothetical protein
MRHRRRARWIAIAATVALLPLLAHALVLAATAMSAPDVPPPAGAVRRAGDGAGRREYETAWARRRGAITEVRLAGDPIALGHAHARLLYEDQVAIETQMHEAFARYVPLAPARWLLVDLARLRFRNLDAAMGEERRREIAAHAAGFAPDPFGAWMPTYQRFVFLEALYDVMLAFERSPLVGCSSFVLGAGATRAEQTLLGRNFDLEGPSALDARKAVFLVHEDGRVPYATVSWPGFVGAATGMNAAGLAVVVHGARAGEPRPRGEPVAHTVRELLGRARTSAEAIDMLAGREPMVTHMLLVADATGDAAVVERVPGAAPFVRRGAPATLGLTNHLEGPHASDAKNQRVLAETSTLPRRRRLDELLSAVASARDGDVARAVSMLRDKHGPSGAVLPLGHRHALDALLATHSVVANTVTRDLWVSEGPHAAGRFVRFDLDRLLDPRYEPTDVEPIETIDADPMLSDGRYQAWRAAGAPREGEP